MTWSTCARTTAMVGLATCLIAPPAWSQQPPAQTEPSPARTADSPATGLNQPAPGPPISAYPLELLGLLAPPAQRGPITLTPSIAISGEYNDNIFSDNANRESDFITSLSPAITLFINKPSYQLTAGYSFNADLYARNSDLTNAFNRQNFVASGVYRISPTLTLSASDSFVFDRNTSVVASGPSTGRQESWSNAFTPSVLWQLSPRNSLSFGGTYGLLRFMGDGAGVDSDTSSVQTTFNHAFTPRLTGSFGYTFTYIDLTQGQEDSTTHRPTVGLSYRITQTLTGTVSGGPAITTIGNDTFVTPTGTVELTQAFRFGSGTISYRRDVGIAGGFGGTNESQTVSAALAVTTLLPGLVVTFTPEYSESTSLGSNRQNENVDVKTITMSLGAAYLIARYTTIFAGYTFLHQRSDSSSSAATSRGQGDVDQNRVRFGVQFGYPFNFD